MNKLNLSFIKKRMALKISFIVGGVVILLQLLSGFAVFFSETKMVDNIIAGFTDTFKKMSEAAQSEVREELNQNMRFNTNMMAAVSAQNIYNLESVESAIKPFFDIKELMAVVVRDDSGNIINVFYRSEGSVTMEKAFPDGYSTDNLMTKNANATFDGANVGKVEVFYSDELLKKSFEKRRLETESNISKLRTNIKEEQINNTIVMDSILFVALIIFLGVISMVIRSMVTPLKHMESFINDMSLGELKNRLNMKRIDEVGAMGKALDSFVDNLQQKADFAEVVASGDLSKNVELASDIDVLGHSLKSMNDDLAKMIKQITDNSFTLSGSSEQLTRISSQISEGTEKMAVQSNTVTSASAEMSTSISTMASGAEEMNANIQSISATSTQMSQNMSTVLESIEGIETSTNDVANKSKSSTEVANKAKEMSESTKTIMEELSLSAHEIGEVTEMIKELAQKTNLLALNANIEAASAGEAGRGFAVVANEIKELAKQSADSAEEIALKVTGIQENTDKSEKANMEMSDIVLSISDSSNHITDLAVEQSNTVQIIVSNIRESTTGVKEIARLISEMSSGAEENARSSGELTLGSNEIAKNMSRLDAIIQETSKGVSQVNQEAQTLSDLATKLQDLIHRFKLA